MELSKKGEDFIVEFEGERFEVYLDPVGLPTLGVGHLLTPAENKAMPVGTRISKAVSREYFRKDLKRFERALAILIKVPVTQNQYDALVSLAFNIGVRNFTNSRVLKYLNKKNYRSAADAFTLWVKAGGKTLPGLIRRRKAERKMFLTPAPETVPVVPERAVAVSDDKGGGGTQTTTSDSPPLITSSRLSGLWDSAMSVIDRLAEARTKVSRLSIRTAVPTQLTGFLSLMFAALGANWELAVLGVVFTILTVAIIWISYKRRHKRKN